MLKIVQPLVVKDDGEVVELQALLANEAKLYSGRLKALQGACTLVCKLGSIAAFTCEASSALHDVHRP